MKIDLDGRKFDMPVHWHEVTLQQILESDKLVKDMPERLHLETFEGKEQEYDEDDLIDNWKFYRKWVGFWTKIPDNYELKIEDVKWLYEATRIFMGSANEDDVVIEPIFNFKGVDYGLPEAERLLNGQTKQMANSSYGEFIESAQLMSKINRLKDGDLTALPLLTAILYRPFEVTGSLWWKKRRVSEYNEDTLMERVEIFKELPMDKVWSAYFFLIKHLATYVSGLATSLRGEEKAQDTVGI
jgi:hypothetical protein